MLDKELINESFNVTIELFDSIVTDNINNRVLQYVNPFDTVRLISNNSMSPRFTVHINLNVFNTDKDKEKLLFNNDDIICMETKIKNLTSESSIQIGYTEMDLTLANVIKGGVIRRYINHVEDINIREINFKDSGDGREFVIYSKIYNKDDKDNYVIKGIAILNFV